MGWDTNVYYNPEKFGLKQVAEIEYSDQCYDFDTRIVWRHEDGSLYTARSAGCSCPVPFEEFESLEDLDKYNYEEIRDESKREVNNDWGPYRLADHQANMRKLRRLK